MENHFVLAVDIGTTSLKGHVYNSKAELLGQSTQKLELTLLKRGYLEIVPETLWSQFVAVGRDAIKDSNVPVDQIAALGISTQRATFTTWNKRTGDHYHNFITWNDTRAAKYAEAVNRAFTFKCLKGGSRIIKWITGIRRYEAASVFSFTTQHVIMRLCWVLDNIEGIREDLAKEEVLFGTIDTWLVWKMTKGMVHATDHSNISTTCLYDVFAAGWNSIHMNFLGIPRSWLPELRDTSGDFGICDAEVFGAEIPIGALIGDQQSALFGQCCFDVGDMKVTFGTGTFVAVNTGSKPPVPAKGAYPLVAWKIKDEICYVLECNNSDCGTVVEWGLSMGYYNSPGESEAVAQSVEDTGGVYFVPAFGGLQSPVNNNSACACLIGLRPVTTSAHITRAMLESVAYSLKQLYDLQKAECRVELSPVIRLDGGASQNGFMMQLGANLLQKPIERASNLDMSCLGAAYLAGLSVGVWKDKEELKSLKKTDVVFQPKPITNEMEHFRMWERAVQRSVSWYTT